MNKTRNKKIENTDNDSSIKIVNDHMNKTTKEFIHFSSFENNTFKIGLNIQEIDPKLKKFVEGNNPDLIKTSIIKNKLIEKVEEFKKQKIKDRKTQRQKDLEEAIKNSVLKNIEKPMVLKPDKQLYKHETEKCRRY